MEGLIVNKNVQVKNLISIREHKGNVRMIGNKFENNSAVKGVVYIETARSN